MKKQLMVALEKLEKDGWITVPENLNREALAAVFIEIMKEMTVKDYLSIFRIDWDQ